MIVAIKSWRKKARYMEAVISTRPIPGELDSQGTALLKLLLDVLSRADPKRPETFISYTGAHRRLGLQILWGDPGRSLQIQGLNNLAGWVTKQNVPAITGLVVREADYLPGVGFFNSYGKHDVDGISWWLDEITRAKEFDWTPHLSQGIVWSAPRLHSDRTSDAPKELIDEAKRIAQLILARVAASGKTAEHTSPVRTAPDNIADLILELLRTTGLICYLCGGHMQIDADNRLLRPSPDRIDSSIANYGPENLKLAHLGCNLGKNDATVDEFSQWLAVLRGDGRTES
jgi:hypothetical protein